MNPEEAREEAWRAWFDAEEWFTSVPEHRDTWFAGADWQRAEVERWVAELLPARETCNCHEAYTNRGLQDPECHYHHYGWLWEELRALGGLAT